jgi:hypothetical protein
MVLFFIATFRRTLPSPKRYVLIKNRTIYTVQKHSSFIFIPSSHIFDLIYFLCDVKYIKHSSEWLASDIFHPFVTWNGLYEPHFSCPTFIYCLMTLSVARIILRQMIGRLFNEEVESIWKETVVAYLKYNPTFSWIVWGNPQKNLSQVCGCPSWDLNRVPSEFKSKYE